MMVMGAFPLGGFPFGHKMAQNYTSGCALFSAGRKPCNRKVMTEGSSKSSVGNCQNRYPSPKGWSKAFLSFRSPFSLNSVRLAAIYTSEALFAQTKRSKNRVFERKGRVECKSNLGLLHWVQPRHCRAVSQQTRTSTTQQSVRQLVQPQPSFWMVTRWSAQSPEQVRAHCATTRAFVTKNEKRCDNRVLGWSRSCQRADFLERKSTHYVPAVGLAPDFQSRKTGAEVSKGLSLCAYLLSSELYFRFLAWAPVLRRRRLCLQKRISNQLCWGFLTLTKSGIGGFSAVQNSILRTGGSAVLRPALAAVPRERAAFSRLPTSQKWVAHV